MSKTMKISLFLWILIIFTFSNLKVVSASSPSTTEKKLVNLYFFHSNTCSHCAEEEKLLTKLEEKYSNLKIYRYEIHEEENQEILKIAQKVYSIPISGVPITIIGEKVYHGYHEEKSKIEIIQTIEYYSRYSYQDRLGEQIGISILPTYTPEEEAQKTINEFIEEYGNYKLIGPITTKQLEPNLIAMLLGILTGCNPIFLLSIILLQIFFKNKKIDWKNKVLLLSFYAFSNFLIFTTYIIRNKFYIGLGIVFLILLILDGIQYYKSKKKEYLYFIFMFLIAILINCLSSFYFKNYISIFINIDNLYLFTGISRLSYYVNYFFSMFLLQILIIILLSTIFQKIMRKFS